MLIITMAFLSQAVKAQRHSAFFEIGGNGGFTSLNFELRLTKQSGFTVRLGLGVSFLEAAEKEEVSAEGSGCVCPDLNFPNEDISIPFSLQYLIPL